MAGMEGERQQTGETRFQEATDQLRALLQAERERRGEEFNEAEFVRQQLTSEFSHAVGEKHQYFQSLLTSFDAVAYGRYTSDGVKEDALNRLAESQASDDRYIDGVVGVTPQVAASLGVLTSALDIVYRRWAKYERYAPTYFVGKGVSLSSKVTRDLIGKGGGKLQRIPRAQPVGTYKSLLR